MMNFKFVLNELFSIVLYLENQRSKELAVLQLLILSFAIFFVCERVLANIKQDIYDTIPEPTVQALVFNAVYFIIFAFCVTVFWPCLHLNQLTNQQYRIMSFGWNIVIIGFVIYEVADWYRRNLFAIYALVLLIIVSIFLLLLLCLAVYQIIDVVVPSHPTFWKDIKYNASYEYVRTKLRIVLRKDVIGTGLNFTTHLTSYLKLVDQDEPNDMSISLPSKLIDDSVVCYDGTSHCSVSGLLDHCHKVHRVSKSELLSNPPVNWTSDYLELLENKRLALFNLENERKRIKNTLRNEFLWPSTTSLDTSGFFYPNLIIFTTVIMIVLNVYATTYYLSGITEIVAPLYDKVDELKICKGNGVCSRIVSIDDGDVLNEFLFGASKQLAKMTDQVSTLQQQELQFIDATTFSLGIFAGQYQIVSAVLQSDTYIKEYYPSAALKSNLSLALFLPFSFYVSVDHWSYSKVMVLSDLLSVMPNDQYAMVMNIQNVTEAGVSKRQLINSLSYNTNDVSNSKCVDVALSVWHHSIVENSDYCHWSCDETQITPTTTEYIGSCLFFYELIDPTQYSILIGIIAACFFCIIGTYQSLLGYKLIVLKFRSGAIKSPKAPPDKSAAFFGLVVSCMYFGYLIIGFFVALGIFVCWWRPTGSWLWSVRGYIASWFFPSIILGFINPILWLKGLKKDEIELARIFSYEQITHMFVFVIKSFWQGLLRVCYIIGLGLLSISRYDFTVFPTELISIDSCFVSMWANILILEPSCNPIAFVFTDSLISDWTKNRHEALSYKRARNRWHLAFLLMKNPSLILYRRTTRSSDLSEKEQLPTEGTSKSAVEECSSPSSSLCPKLWKSSKVHVDDYNDVITSVNISGVQETPQLLSQQNVTTARVICDTIAPSDYIEPFRLIDAKEYESNVKLDSAVNHPHHLQADV